LVKIALPELAQYKPARDDIFNRIHIISGQ
jgi:hypothetical protein